MGEVSRTLLWEAENSGARLFASFIRDHLQNKLSTGLRRQKQSKIQDALL